MTASLVPVLLITSAALGGTSRGVLLDFSATWCGPCQQMNPVVSRLERQGYPIRKVDVDQERELAERFGISSIPAFVLVVDGQEVTRITGATSEDQLVRMLEQIPSDPPALASAPSPRTSAPGHPDVELGEPSRFAEGETRGEPRPQPSPATPRNTNPQDEPAKSGNLFGRLLGRRDPPQRPEPAVIRGNDDFAAEEPISLLPVRDPLRASVRLHVTINGQSSVGSGTAIESRPGRTVLVTCGHLFKGWNEQSKIEVDVFTEAGVQKYVGRMVSYDVDADVGIVTVPTDHGLATAEVPDVEGRPHAGDNVVNIGCSGGAAPTQEAVQVTALNYFEGPDNVECTGVPVQGRSGGGLFNREGQLIGICIGADSQRQRGAYAGLLAIHDQLDLAGLTALYRGVAQPANGAAQVAADDVPDARSFDAFADTSMDVAAPDASTPAGFEHVSDAAANAIMSAGDAEVICIIRDRREPGTPSRVVIIDRASPTFLSYLSGEVKATAMNSSPPAATRTNRPATPPVEAPPQLTDPQSLFQPSASSRPLFSAPGEPRIGERSRSASLQPTAMEEPFVPQRYVRTSGTRG